MNSREKFNHAHAKLRNVIERAFGVLKARFPILKKTPSYPFITQREIVIACFAIHNFIRKERLSDEFFSLYDHHEVHDSSNLQDNTVVDEDVQPYGSAADQEYMTHLRDSILTYAGMTVSAKAALLQGMSPRVFVFYRQAFGTLFIAPVAYFSRTKAKGNSMGWKSFSLIFTAALIGVTGNQMIQYEGIYLATSSAASALSNLIPAITFVAASIIGY
ncbi:nodulin MtN21 /EamA-like transporter family protein [Tanacetum coccineum]